MHAEGMFHQGANRKKKITEKPLNAALLESAFTENLQNCVYVYCQGCVFVCVCVCVLSKVCVCVFVL